MSKAAAPLDTSAKRQTILNCAIDVFAAHGFRNTDVQVIADEAGVGKGTVYRYFGNKEELFLATVDAAMGRLEEHYFAAVDGINNIYERIRTGAMAYTGFFGRHPELMEIMIQERAEFRGSVPDTHLMYREKNRAGIEKIFKQAITAGEVRRLNVTEAVNAYANMLFGIVLTGCMEGSAQKIRQTTKHAVDIFIEGIRPRKSSTNGRG